MDYLRDMSRGLSRLNRLAQKVKKLARLWTSSSTLLHSYDGCKLVEEEGNRFELENVKFVESDKEGTVDIYLDWAHDGEVDDGLES